LVVLICPLWGCPPGEGLNGGVNNLNCPPGSSCDWECNGGVCNIDCDSGSTCDVTCNGGVCNLTCHADAICDFDCNGGVCNLDCAPGSTCERSGVEPGGAGGGGGSDVDPPGNCVALCGAMDTDVSACVETALAGQGHDFQTPGCEDLSNPERCAACLGHLRVPDAHCTEAGAACL
jgi:hypothetical protein